LPANRPIGESRVRYSPFMSSLSGMLPWMRAFI
jgi:hypothetical protein